MASGERGDGMGFTSTCPSLPNPAAQFPRKTPQMLPFELTPPAGGQANHGLLNLCQACQPLWARVASPSRVGWEEVALGLLLEAPTGTWEPVLCSHHWGWGGGEVLPGSEVGGRNTLEARPEAGVQPASGGPQSPPRTISQGPENGFLRHSKGNAQTEEAVRKVFNAGTSAAPGPQSQAIKEGG